jgi:hypothetical protein
VLDAAVRSWPPVAPRCLRWAWPLWTPAPDLDPTALRKPTPRRQRKPEGDDTAKPVDPPWDARRFADAIGKPEPQPRSVILDAARLLGLSDRRAETLLKGALDRGYLVAWRDGGAATPTMVATVRPATPPPEATPEPPPRRGRRPKIREKHRRKNAKKIGSN